MACWCITTAVVSRLPIIIIKNFSYPSSPTCLKSPSNHYSSLKLLNNNNNLIKLKSYSYSGVAASSSCSAAAMSYSSSSYSYDDKQQLIAAKKAVSLAARLCQKVQKELLQSDVQSKSDKSPVTVADYGSQVLVSFVLQKELPAQAFSLVAEEDSGDLRKEESQETLQRITKLVNDTIANDGTYNVPPLSEAEVLTIIDCGTSEGGSNGQHWVLDPIDGTKGFLRGDQYAIALGLLDEGEVVLGVLACPNLPLESIRSQHQNAANKAGCLFSARLGCGTYMESLDGSPPIKDLAIRPRYHITVAILLKSLKVFSFLRHHVAVKLSSIDCNFIATSFAYSPA